MFLLAVGALVIVGGEVRWEISKGDRDLSDDTPARIVSTSMPQAVIKGKLCFRFSSGGTVLGLGELEKDNESR